MPETNAPRLPRTRTTPRPPEWARVIERFYADSFDARDKDALLESVEAFADLSPEDQVFHQAHLAFRQVQALADIHATLQGIERGLARLDPKALAALKHLPGIRKALIVIAKGQDEMLDALASNGEATRGDQDADDDPGDDGDDDDDGDPGSDLEDAVDGDADDESDDEEIEEEDHGSGDALVPEVLPAGSRPAAAITAEDVLARRARGAP